MFEISIYGGTKRIAIIANEDPKQAWLAAKSYVRTKARADGCDEGSTWARTANRDFVECGQYRALPTVLRSNGWGLGAWEWKVTTMVKKIQTTAKIALCEVFLLCQNPATTYLYNPILGRVPSCERCRAKMTQLAEGGRNGPR